MGARIIRSGWYVIKNTMTDHIYVGSSKDLTSRKSKHWDDCRRNDHHSPYLQNAWNKYGEESFVFEIIEQAKLPYDPKRGKIDTEYSISYREMLVAREQYYIDYFHPEYNICQIARSRLGVPHSEESKAKLSITAKAHMSRPEIAEKYRQLRLGKSWETLFGIEQSEQMKRSVSEKRTGQRLGISPPNKGVPMSAEQNIILQAAREAYVAEHGVWNAGSTWEEVLGAAVSVERKTEYARLADKWFSIDENRERHREAVSKGTQARVEREGKHWITGTTRSVEQRRKDALSYDGTLHEFQGELRSVPEIARLVGSTRELIRDRLARGETIEQAVRSERSKGGSKLGHEISNETARKISEAQKGKSRDWQKGKSSKPSKSGEFGIQVRPDGRFAVRLQNKVYGKHLTLEEAIAHRDELLRLQKGA